MKTIPIRTTQNVTIEYELPSTLQRIVSWIIDAAILTVVMFILLICFSIVLGALRIFSDKSYFYFYMFVILPIYVFYFLVSEVLFNGQSIGKRAMGIRVVKLNGSIPSLWDYTLRWACRFIDVFMSGGSLAVLLITASDKGQRLGDILAGTTVIKIKSQQHVDLKELLTIRSHRDYEPVHTNVISFTEEEMLTIKTVLNRSNRFPNQKDTNNLLEKTAILVAQKLDLPTHKSMNLQEAKAFLFTILQDYIVLTR